MSIDISYDVRTDAGGKDPDAYSETLRRYHRLLWSKPLPSGKLFALSEDTKRIYLHHHSEIGEFFLSSDSVMQTFLKWPALKPVTGQFSESEHEQFLAAAHTIGAMMIFPGNQIDRKFTINQDRGMRRSIADRFDLTLECIRRYYLEQSSPLSATLARYSDFFALFGDFDGYVSFFLLDDLVAQGRVKFFLPFEDFQPTAVPKSAAEFAEVRRNSLEFIAARNGRIQSLKI